MLGYAYAMFAHDGVTLRAWIGSVLDEVGPRESCSKEERALGEKLAAEWQTLGLGVERHTFRCRPRAFMGSVPIGAGLFLAGAGAFWAGLPSAVVAACFALTLVVLTAEVVLYIELTDFLFAEKEGTNVLARLAPTGPIERRVVVSAHMDSAYEFNLWYWFKNASVPVMILGFTAPLWALMAMALEHLDVVSHGLALGVMGGLCPILALHLFWHTYRLVPGAMDDLAGVSVLVGLGRQFAAAKAAGHGLAGTELVLMGASSEEAGLRGAKRYVRDFLKELKEVPTFGIFVDGVYDERHLTIISRELLALATHDPALVKLAQDTAEKQGKPFKTGWIPLGASDGAAFAHQGVSSVTLLCQDNTQLVPNYHTRLDTLEHVRPESIDTMLGLVAGMIRRLDTGSERG